MTAMDKKIFSDIKERLIRIEDKVTVQNGRVGKNEIKIEELQTKVILIDKVVSVNNIWDKGKSIVIWILCSMLGAMSSYIFLR